MNSNNLRNEIEQVLTTYRSEATRDRTMLEMSNRDDDKIPTPIDEATSQILSLLESCLPKKKDTRQKDIHEEWLEEDWHDPDYKYGWNDCLEEIKEKIK